MALVRDLLTQQRRRMLGTVMRYIEEEVYPSLDEVGQRSLRQKVLAAVNQYHDACLDLATVASGDVGTVVNDEALRLIAEMHADVRRLLQED